MEQQKNTKELEELKELELLSDFSDECFKTVMNNLTAEEKILTEVNPKAFYNIFNRIVLTTLKLRETMPI